MEDETPRESRKIDVGQPIDPAPPPNTSHQSSNGAARPTKKAPQSGMKPKRKKNRHVSKRADLKIKVLQTMFRYNGRPSFKSFGFVARALGISVQAVIAIVVKAFEAGDIWVGLNVPHDVMLCCQLAGQLKIKYGLLDVVVVPGNDDMIAPANPERAREIHREILASLVRSAASYLDLALADAARATKDGHFRLGVSWGRTMQKLAAELNYTARPSKFPGLEVVPIIGSTGVSYSEGVEANTVAANIAFRYCGQAAQMPCPAFLERLVEAAIHKRNHQVKKVLEKARDCDVYITGMGPILDPDPERADTSTRLVNDDAMFNNTLARLAYLRGAVAEICYWLVDADGDEVETSYEAIGCGFKKLRAAAANRNKRVILVTGGDNRRFEPLRAILKARLASVLITDATTAQKLLEK